MATQEYRIRNMKQSDMDVAIAWAAREGWNPGLQDTGSFWACDPTGFFLGLLGDEPVGCISAVKYENDFAFIGFYIVKEEYRGQGYGIQLWKHAMDSLQGRNIGLDGVVAQQENYKKSGFHLAYRNFRYEGILDNQLINEPLGLGLIPLREVPFQQVLDYDRFCFPAARETFLRAWIDMPNAVGYAKLVGRTLRGYGMIRSCQVGYRIGPLFGDDAQIAEELFLALVDHTHGAPFYLDTLEVNPEAVALAERYRMQRVFDTARMYTKDAPVVQVNKVFGVTSLELG